MTTEPLISSLGIIYIENERYAVLEVFDENGLPTGIFYYFDMVAREFILQPYPQAEATPPPPIAVTIPPIQSKHPHQP